MNNLKNKPIYSKSKCLLQLSNQNNLILLNRSIRLQLLHNVILGSTSDFYTFFKVST